MIYLKFDFKFPRFAEALKAAMPELQRKAMATVQTNRGMLFKNEGAYNGHSRWKELASGASLRTDKKSGEKERRILQKTGTLKNSISPQGANRDLPVPGPGGILKFTGEKLTIGTNVKYAAIHNYGGVVKHKGYDVVIPKRPFLEGAWNKQDQEELNTTMRNKIQRILDGAK